MTKQAEVSLLKQSIEAYEAWEKDNSIEVAYQHCNADHKGQWFIVKDPKWDFNNDYYCLYQPIDITKKNDPGRKTNKEMMDKHFGNPSKSTPHCPVCKSEDIGIDGHSNDVGSGSTSSETNKYCKSCGVWFKNITGE